MSKDDKDELIEFIKDNLRLDVSYKHDNYVELQLFFGKDIVTAVTVATDLGGE